MGAINRDELIDEIADLANTYLSAGSQIQGVETVDPEERINSIEELLVRYFVVTGFNDFTEDPEASALPDPAHEQDSPDVIPFVHKLPDRVQRLQTTTKNEIETMRGRIEGHVDWQATAAVRARRGTTDQRLFACRQTDEVIETPENKLLVTLIDRIYNLVSDREKVGQQDDPPLWLKPWMPDYDLLQNVEWVKFKHPVLSEIDPSTRPIPSKTIEAVLNARMPLYREAARLLRLYQRYNRGEYSTAELRELFNNLFVGPESDAELFELYWGYKLIEAHDPRRLTPVFDKDKSDTNVLGTWDADGSRYVVRFKSMPRSISSEISLNDSKNELVGVEQNTYLKRYTAATARETFAKREFLEVESRSILWRGTPDLIMTKSDIQTGELEAIFLTEVKSVETFDEENIKRQIAEGIEDLTKYLELFRPKDGSYLSFNPDVRVVGAVCAPPYSADKTAIPGIRLYTWGDDIIPPFQDDAI